MSDSPGTTTERPANRKRPYYRPTTVDQRKLLFRVYEETGNVWAAVATAHVGKSTFYDRPHQGRELAGLSPNEYARRLPAA